MRPFLFTVLALIAAAVSVCGPVSAKKASSPPAPQPVVQAGFAGGAEELTFSPDGRLLAAAGGDGSVRLWHMGDGTLTWSRELGDCRLAFSQDSHRLAILHYESSEVSLCEADSGRTLTHWRLSAAACKLAWSPNGKLLACGSTDRSVDLCDPTTGKVFRSLRTHGASRVEALAFSPDSNRLFCAGGIPFNRNRTVDVFDVHTGETLAALRLSGYGTCGAFSNDGSLLAIGCDDWPSPGNIEVWDTRNWSRTLTLAHHLFGLASLAFGPGDLLFGMDRAGVQSEWDLRLGKLLRTEGVPGKWGASALSARLAAIDTDDGIQLLNPTGGEPLRQLPGNLPSPEALAVSPDGLTAVVISGRRIGNTGYSEAALWDLRTGQWKGAIPWQAQDVKNVVISPDGRTAAVLEFGSTVALLDLQSRAFLRRARSRNLDEHLTSLGFLGNDRFWVGGTRQRPGNGSGFRIGDPEPDEPVLEVFDVADGRRLFAAHPEDEVLAAAPAAFGGRLEVFTANGKLLSYDASGQIAGSRELISEPGRKTACFSKSGSFLAIGNDDGVRLWNLPGGGWLGPTIPASGYSALEAVSDLGLYLLNDEDERHVVTDGRTGRECARITPALYLYAGAFLPGGNELVCGYRSGRIEVVRGATGASRAAFTLLPRWKPTQEWLAMTPGGYYVGSPGAEQFLRWRAGPSVLPADRVRGSRRDPARVQIALTGHRSADVFQTIAEAAAGENEARMRHWTEIIPRPRSNPEPTTPNERLARALSTGDYYAESWSARLPKMIKAVRAQLDQGADPNTMGSWGTPLMLAVAAGDTQFVRDLIRRGARVDDGDASHRNALQRAAMEDSAEVAQILLDAGAQLTDFDGKSLLGRSKPELNQALRDAADVYDNKYKAKGDPFLGPNTAWLLLHLGADPNTRSADGSSLLNHAFHPWLIRMLLRKGADPNFRTPKNEAPLIFCVMLGYTEQVALLLDAGADPNVRSTQGGTALINSAREGKFEIAQLLLEHHANPNLSQPDGATALLAASEEHLETLKLLLDHHADPNIQSHDGKTPLMTAVTHLDPGAVKLLLRHGANPRVLTADGKTLAQLLTETDPVDRFDIRRLLQPSP